MKIQRISQAIFLLTTLTISARAQEIASKDLLRTATASSAMSPIQIEEKPENPNGCRKMGAGGYVDGVTLDEDKKPRKLRVELVEISTRKLTIGSEIIATAKLQNVGGKSVRIPWSTDFRTTMNGQDPDSRSWEVAEFRMSIRDQQNPKYYDKLVTTSSPLYASRFVPDSYLRIEPGQWVTARISFMVVVQNPEFEKLNVGTNTLAMEWFQTARSRVVKDCSVTLGYFPYDDPFESVNRSEVAEVQVEGPRAATKPAQ